MIHLTLVVRKDCDKLIQWYVSQIHLSSQSLAALYRRTSSRIG
jgi:hypothetical protein